jgi:hypothetical protein
LVKVSEPIRTFGTWGDVDDPMAVLEAIERPTGERPALHDAMARVRRRRGRSIFRRADPSAREGGPVDTTIQEFDALFRLARHFIEIFALA